MWWDQHIIQQIITKAFDPILASSVEQFVHFFLGQQWKKVAYLEKA